jgi:RHS repeat-associated protein
MSGITKTRILKSNCQVGRFVTNLFNSYHWRVGRQDDLGTTLYLRDKYLLLWETDEFGTPTIKYTHEPAEYGNLVSRQDLLAGVTSFYHYDALGSTAALTDPSEVVEATYSYHAFGDVAESSGTIENAFQWVGQLGYQYDEAVDRHHVGRRDYSDYLGRFLSDDPKGFA